MDIPPITDRTLDLILEDFDRMTAQRAVNSWEPSMWLALVREVLALRRACQTHREAKAKANVRFEVAAARVEYLLQERREIEELEGML